MKILPPLAAREGPLVMTYYITIYRVLYWLRHQETLWVCRKYLFPLYDQHHRHLRIRKRSRRRKKGSSRHIILSTPFFRTVDKKRLSMSPLLRKKSSFSSLWEKPRERKKKSEYERKKKIKGINVDVFYILAKFVLAQTKVRDVEEIIVEVDDDKGDEAMEREELHHLNYCGEPFRPLKIGSILNENSFEIPLIFVYCFSIFFYC